jgi:hypothetical protein
MREPAKIGLGSGVRGDVAGDADHADDFPGGVGDRSAQAIQDAKGTVRKGVGLGKAEREPGAQRGFEVSPKFVDVLEIQDSPEIVKIARKRRRVQTVQAEELLRPSDGAGGEIKFPSTHFGDFLGMFQDEFGFADALFEEVLGGNVLNLQDQAGSLVG